MKRLLLSVIAVAGATLCGASLLSAEGWPQWRGPARDGIIAGRAARAAWPEALKTRWKLSVGVGHASPVVVDERVFVFAREDEAEVLQALELATGRRVWRQSYPAPYAMSSAARSHGPGPKSTPVVAGGRVCTLGIGGVLSCFDAASGRLLWRKELAQQHRETSPLYGCAMSPLIDGGRVIAHVGGGGDGALAAFDGATGALKWAWRGDGPAYASPVVADVAGVRQVITFSESHLVGVAADTGELLWSLPFTTDYVQNAVTPVVHRETVIFSGLDHPVKAVRIVREGSGFAAQTVWENTEVASYMSSPVLVGGRLYGLSHRRKGQFYCLDATTGKTLWLSEGRQGENAALLAGGGALFALTTDSELIVADTSAAAFAPLGRYRVASTPTWAHPVVLEDGFLVKDADSLAYLEFATSTVTSGKEPRVSWILFMAGAALSWGLYGPVLHRGQSALGHPLRALLCVGAAYFLIGVVVPLFALGAQGQLRGFTTQGIAAAGGAGALGAIGAICIIWAFRSGGSPLYVMPLVFAGAPVVNALFSLWQHPPKASPSPMLYVGFVLAALGGYLVLHYKPQA